MNVSCYQTNAQLRHAAGDGPVIVLNASTYRCDALILPAQEEPLRHIHLKTFTFEQAQGLQTLMRNIMTNRGLHDGNDGDRMEKVPTKGHIDEKQTPNSGDSLHQVFSRLGRLNNSGDERVNIFDDDERFRTLLAELWNSVVKQVLDCLGLQVSHCSIVVQSFPD